MDAETRDCVRRRAEGRCEYCRLPQEAYDLSFHIEHVIASQHQFDDSPENLALACDRCNLYKEPNLSSIDPESREIVNLFNPRNQVWSDHFGFVGAEIVGLTPTGRATARLLNMNSSRRLQLRKLLIEDGTC